MEGLYKYWYRLLNGFDGPWGNFKVREGDACLLNGENGMLETFKRNVFFVQSLGKRAYDEGVIVKGEKETSPIFGTL
jgi:hypothetical protein